MEKYTEFSDFRIKKEFEESATEEKALKQKTPASEEKMSEGVIKETVIGGNVYKVCPLESCQRPFPASKERWFIFL